MSLADERAIAILHQNKLMSSQFQSYFNPNKEDATKLLSDSLCLRFHIPDVVLAHNCISVHQKSGCYKELVVNGS